MKNKLIKNKHGATGLSPFVKSLVMVILGALCIVSFAFFFIQQRNPTSDIFQSKYGINDSMNNLQTSLNGFTDVANTVQETLDKANPSPLDYVFLIFLGAFQIPKTFLYFIGSAAGAVINVFLGIITIGVGQVAGFTSQIGGLIALIAGVILSILIVTAVLLIIKAIRTGESER